MWSVNIINIKLNLSSPKSGQHDVLFEHIYIATVLRLLELENIVPKRLFVEMLFAPLDKEAFFS